MGGSLCQSYFRVVFQMGGWYPEFTKKLQQLDTDRYTNKHANDQDEANETNGLCSKEENSTF